MHQTNEQRVREALMRLLGPVDLTWVAEQVGVKRQSVWHWSHGKHTSQERLDQVAAAVRTLLPEHEEAAPPDWARRTIDIVAVLAKRDGITEDEILEAEAAEAARRALADQQTTGSPKGGGAGGASGA